ncbi:AAA family ATPase [Clostridium tertium]|uniref:Septum site-determining protein MinD n=1 Tax=Clostridium tertium TaxID=1559 RepID=A0A6N3A7U5_9CLOT
MAKTSIMLIDSDENYLIPLELKFVEAFDDNAEISVITDMDYLQKYFSLPREIDILIISEKLFNEGFRKHNIKNIFVLNEDKLINEATGDLKIHNIFKYTSVKEIYTEVINNSVLDVTNDSSKGNVIMVYSPSGGIGKTTISFGIGSALKMINKRVLYINTDILQSFNFLLSKKEYCDTSFEKYITNNTQELIEHLDEGVRSEIIDYLLPFRQALSSININMKDYSFMIKKIKESGKYDYIIVDTSSEFTNEKSILMSYCDKVAIITGQSKADAIKLSSLQYNIDSSNTNKFIFICNKYKEDKKNYLIDDDFIKGCTISEYIEEFKEENIDLSFLASCKKINKLAFIFE